MKSFVSNKIGRKAGEPWLVRNLSWLKAFIRIVFGIVWLVDGYLKFLPGLPSEFAQMVEGVGQGQPSWLQPWFNFWYGAVVANPSFWVYLTGVMELALGAALVLGVLRKMAYTGGTILSLFIWAVPEGFGGPYGPGSTDIGTGIIYSFVFILLMIVNAKFGPSSLSLDAVIEKHLKWWNKLAEFGSIVNMT